MKVMSVFHTKEDRANQSPAPSARSVIVQPDVVVGGGVHRRLLYSAHHSIQKRKSFPPPLCHPRPDRGSRVIAYSFHPLGTLDERTLTITSARQWHQPETPQAM